MSFPVRYWPQSGRYGRATGQRGGIFQCRLRDGSYFQFQWLLLTRISVPTISESRRIFPRLKCWASVLPF